MYSYLLLCLLPAVILGQDANDVVDFDCPERTGFFPDAIQCDLYYSCTQGKPVAKLCPDGLVFSDKNPNHERCDLPAIVDCADRNELQDPKPTKGCPRANGYFKHVDPEICDKFFNCIDGKINEVPCPPGLIYDDSIANCAWPHESKRTDCLNQKKESLDDGFRCPDGDTLGPNDRVLPHPTFPNLEDCQKFYICRNGIMPQKGSCPYGEVYNEETFKCDEPANVSGCENYYEGKEKDAPEKVAKTKKPTI